MEKTLVILFTLLLLTGCTIPESTPIERVTLSESGVYSADISKDGSMAIVSSVNGAIDVFSLTPFEKLYTWRHQEEGNNLVEIVKFSPDKSVAVTADSEAFALWNVANGEPLGFWRIDESTIRDIAVSNGGESIMVGRANGQILFFEPYTGRRLEFLGHEEKINAVDLSANGRFALTGSNDYRAYLWDTQSGQIVHVFAHPNRVTQVSIDQEARYLFTSDGQNDAQIWDAQTGKAVSQLDFIERQIIFTASAFADDGNTLLTGSPARRLTLWDTTSGSIVKEWRVKPNPGPAPQSAVVYAVGFQNGVPISIASNGFLSKWSIADE